jgi:hypothetical protein
MAMENNKGGVIAWNIRRAVNARGKRRIKELVTSFQPSIIILLETHCRFEVAASFGRILSMI